MREELISGLQNALERGSSLEDAKQSLVNAGYNQVEVDEAASALTSGATTILSPPPTISKSSVIKSPPPFQPSRPAPAIKPVQEQQPKSQNQISAPVQQLSPKTLNPRTPINWKRVSLIGFLILVLLGLVGAIVWVLMYGKDFLK